MSKQRSGNRKRPGREATYDDAFKIALATEYLKGEMGYTRLASKHKLPSPFTVRHCVKWYKARYGSATTADEQQEPPKATIEPPPPSEREAALAKELEQARMKIVGLQTLIAVASKELGIDIAKKAGAKQSKS
jgi:transposase-like protein